MTTEQDLEYDFSGAYGSTAAEEEHAKRTGPAFNVVDFMKLDASAKGEAQGLNVGVVQLINDFEPITNEKGQAVIADKYDVPWITVDMHSMVNTKPAPADLDDDAKKRWPKQLSAVCRKDKIFTKMFGGRCWVCETYPKNRPGPRTWALAILREEVRDEQQRLQGLRDLTKELALPNPNPTGDDDRWLDETVTIPRFVKLNWGWQNFYSALQGFGQRYGTVMDRSYFIKRVGTGPSDTVYHPQPYDPTGTRSFAGERQPDGSMRYDHSLLRETYKDIDAHFPDLRRIIYEQASDEYFNRNFIVGANDGVASGGPTGPAAPAGPAGPQPAAAPGQPAAPPAQPAAGADTSVLDGLRERVMTGGASGPQGPGN